MVAALDAKTKQNTRCTNLCYSLHTVNRHAKSKTVTLRVEVTKWQLVCCLSDTCCNRQTPLLLSLS